MSNLQMYSYLKIVFFIAVLTFTSCKTQRSIIKAPLKIEGEQYLLERMTRAETKYAFFNAKCSISVIDDKKNKMDFNGQLRIQKDSVIWISMSPALGIEVARLIITQDSIKFINRLDKTYFDGDFSLANSYFTTTIDYDILHSLLTGNDLNFYEDDSFRAGVDGMEYQLSTINRISRKKYLKQKNTPNVLVQSIWLNPNHFKIVKVGLKEFGDENKRMQADYKNFENVDGQLVPTEIEFEIHGGRKINVKIDYSRIEIDQKLSFPFNIPGSYSKMK